MCRMHCENLMCSHIVRCVRKEILWVTGDCVCVCIRTYMCVLWCVCVEVGKRLCEGKVWDNAAVLLSRLPCPHLQTAPATPHAH